MSDRVQHTNFDVLSSRGCIFEPKLASLAGLDILNCGAEALDIGVQAPCDLSAASAWPRDPCVGLGGAVLNSSSIAAPGAVPENAEGGQPRARIPGHARMLGEAMHPLLGHAGLASEGLAGLV